jgi:hypothetical protein
VVVAEISDRSSGDKRVEALFIGSFSVWSVVSPYHLMRGKNVGV